MPRQSLSRVLISISLIFLLASCTAPSTQSPSPSSSPTSTDASTQPTEEITQASVQTSEPTNVPTELVSIQPNPDALYIRVNQVGYLSTETKVALALTNVDLSAQSFDVNTDGQSVYTGT